MLAVVVALLAPPRLLRRPPRTAGTPFRDIVSRSAYTDALPKHPEPDRRLGDIVKNSVSYGTDLVVTTKFRSLAATGHQEFSWFVLPSDSEDGYWTASFVVEPGKDKGHFTLLDPLANQPGCASAAVESGGPDSHPDDPLVLLGRPRLGPRGQRRPRLRRALPRHP